MTVTVRGVHRWLTWLVGPMLGAGIGLAVSAPAAYVAAGVGVVAVIGGLLGTRVRFEFVVAAYWITFVVFSTMLVDAVIPGMFYPFYGALLLGAVVAVAVGGLRLVPVVAWTYVAFLFLVVASLFGYTDPLAVDRLIVYPFGALVLLQFRSPQGLRTVSIAATLTSLAVSIWVIVEAAQGGFAYRGDIEINQNVVSMYIALGFLTALAGSLHVPRGRGVALRTILGLIVLGTMTYAIVLLASRGMIISALIASTALLVRTVVADRRRLRFLLVLALLVGVGFLLPGSEGLIARFEEPNTVTGGGRVTIWAAVVDSLTQASPRALLAGHGFEASQRVVERHFASLTSTHNAYLQVLYDFGVLGLAAFLVLHAYAVLRSWRIGGRDGAVMIGLVTFLLTANLFMTTPDSFMYWTALGFVLAIATWHGARGTAAAHGP